MRMYACIIRRGIVLGEYCYIIYYKQRRGGTSAGLSSHFIEFEFCPSFEFGHLGSNNHEITSFNLESFFVFQIWLCAFQVCQIWSSFKEIQGLTFKITDLLTVI